MADESKDRVRAEERPKVTARGLLSALMFVLLMLFGVFSWATTSLVAVQPIGAIPDGVTLWVWRSGQMNFFDSPDAICNRASGGVSLLCRGIVLGTMRDRVIARLPYSETIYLWSTGGRTYGQPAPREGGIDDRARNDGVGQTAREEPSLPDPPSREPSERAEPDESRQPNDTTDPNKPPPQ